MLIVIVCGYSSVVLVVMNYFVRIGSTMTMATGRKISFSKHTQSNPALDQYEALKLTGVFNFTSQQLINMKPTVWGRDKPKVQSKLDPKSLQIKELMNQTSDGNINILLCVTDNEHKAVNGCNFDVRQRYGNYLALCAVEERGNGTYDVLCASHGAKCSNITIVIRSCLYEAYLHCPAVHMWQHKVLQQEYCVNHVANIPCHFLVIPQMSIHKFCFISHLQYNSIRHFGTSAIWEQHRYRHTIEISGVFSILHKK